MKSLFTLLLVSVLYLPSALRAQDQTPEDRYIRIFGIILQGDRTLENGRAAAAWTNYNDALTELKRLKVDYPDWSIKIVKYRMDDVVAKMADTVKKGAPAPNVLADKDAAPIETDPPGPVEFKLAWEVGKRYLHRIVATQDTDIMGADKTSNQKTKMTHEIAITPVKELESGGRELDVEIVGVAMESSMEGAKLNFDSKQPADSDGNNPVAPMMRRMVGGKFKLLTDTNGAIESVQGLEDFIKKVAGAEAEAGGTAELLKGMVSEDSMKTLSPLMQGMPDRAVRVGDTWPVKSGTSLGPLGDLSVNLTYTFKGWQMRDNRKCAVFDYTGDLSSKPAAEGAPAPMFAIEQGKASGRTWYAPVLHTTILSRGNQDVSIKLNLPGGQPINTRMRQGVEANLVETAPSK